MRTPEEIKKQIRELEQELITSLNLTRYKKIEDNGRTIGPFHVVLLEDIFGLLYRGEVIQLRHSALDITVDFHMNPQRNRIITKNGKERINPENILDFVAWGYGDFYLDTQPTIKTSY